MKEPIWLTVMRGFIGLQEVPGSKSNPVILNWVKLLDAPSWYDNDDLPWCGLGLNAVFWCCQMVLALGKLKFDGKPEDPYNVFRAKSFETWGEPLLVPVLGCVMVFARPKGGHVGLYLGERRDAYCILGMNQGNSVGVAWIKKDRLTATRWPTEEPLPTSGRVWLENDGTPASTNEG